MRKPARVALKPGAEAMEGRILLSATPGQVSVLNPRIVAVGEGPGAVSFSETPKLIQIVVVSQAGAHPFAPVSQLVPGTIKIDGIRFHNVDVRADGVDVNGDGIPDAIVSVRTNSLLRFPPGEGVLTVAGTLRHGAAVWTGAAPIDVEENLGSGAGGGLGGGGGVLNSYVNGYVTINNATRNTYLYTVTAYNPLGGSPNVGTTATFYPGTPVTINTGPGFFGPSFVIKVAITIPGRPRLPPATFGYLNLSTSPSVTSQFNLILNNQGQLVFVPA